MSSDNNNNNKDKPTDSNFTDTIVKTLSDPNAAPAWLTEFINSKDADYKFFAGITLFGVSLLFGGAAFGYRKGMKNLEKNRKFELHDKQAIIKTKMSSMRNTNLKKVSDTANNPAATAIGIQAKNIEDTNNSNTSNTNNTNAQSTTSDSKSESVSTAVTTNSINTSESSTTSSLSSASSSSTPTSPAAPKVPIMRRPIDKSKLTAEEILLTHEVKDFGELTPQEWLQRRRLGSQLAFKALAYSTLITTALGILGSVGFYFYLGDKTLKQWCKENGLLFKEYSDENIKPQFEGLKDTVIPETEISFRRYAQMMQNSETAQIMRSWTNKDKKETDNQNQQNDNNQDQNNK